MDRRLNHSAIKITVGLPGIPPSISPRALLMESAFNKTRFQLACFCQTFKQVVSLGIYIRRSDVSDLSGRSTEADPLVVDGRANPFRATIVAQFIALPKTYVMPMPGIIADRLLKSDVFLASIQIQTADRSSVIWS